MTEKTLSQERPVRRVALCIGIGTYTHLPNQRLRYAVDDAQAMAEMLGDENRGPYEVTLLTEPAQTTKQQVQKALFRVLHTPGLQAEDLVLISISSHGALSEDGQTFCLLPSDVRMKPDAKVEPDKQVDPATILDIHDLTQVLANASVNNCVCFLDICHSGGAGAIFRHLPLNLSTDTNLFIVGAARQDQPAWQSSTVKHGFFTHAVLQAFQQQPDIEGWVTINQVLDFVSKEIRQQSSAKVARIQITSSTVDPSLPILRNPYYIPRTNVPFSPSPFFLGRQEVLKDLMATFQTTRQAKSIQPQALCGLGGIGKTQLALEYARRARGQYQAVLWADAETRESLLSSFVQMAQVLDLPGKEEQDQMRVVEAVKRWLHTQTRWLLILDNTEDPIILREFLPPNMGGHLLLTTRASTLGTFARCLPVKSLEAEQGTLLVLRRGKLIALDAPLEQATKSDRAAARNLVDELAGLPLALDQAGAYIDETGCGVTGYLHLYQQKRAVVLKQRGWYEQDYLHSVATTWSLSFERVEKSNPAAVNLLRLCAFLAPDAIPEELLTKGSGELGEILASVTADSHLLDQAIMALRAYSLLARDPQARTLTVHRLVQVVLRDSMDTETQQQWMQRAVSAISETYPDPDFANWSTFERLLPHALIGATWIEQALLTMPKSAYMLNQTGNYLRERARYGESEPLLVRALAMFKKELGATHPDTAMSMNSLGELYAEQGKYAEAELLHQQALTICEQQLGATHPYTATSLNNLAEIYQKQGKYGEAEPLLKRALAIREQQLGATHPYTVSSLNNLAMLYYARGKYAEAEPLLKRALEIREQQLGPEHPDTAMSLNNLAELCRTQSKYGEAEPLYQRTLAICEQQLGPEHPNTVSSLNNLAELYSEQGKYGEAEPLYQRALAIREQQLGPEHPDTATSLNNLAGLYYSQGKYEEAVPLLKRSLAICEQQLGLVHPNTASNLNNLAFLYNKQGMYGEAEPLFRRALAIREQQLGPEHPDTATSLNNLAGLYIEQAKYGEAEPLLKRALEIHEQQLGPEHPDTAQSLNYLSFLYIEQGKYGEAEPLYQRTLAIREQQLGPEHPDTAQSLNNLAELYRAQGKYTEMEPLFRRALAIDTKVYGAEHPDVATDLNNLAGLYDTLGKYTEAEPLFRRALAIYERQLGATHPTTATILNNLAGLYYSQGKYGEAESLFRRALAIREQQLGPEHPDTATSLNNLARLYIEQAKYKEAEPLLKRALAIYEQTLGLEHPRTQDTRQGYVFLLRKLGRNREAKKLEEGS